MIVSVEENGKQIASVKTFNSASKGNAIERNIRDHPFPIEINDIIRGLRKEKVALGLDGAEVFFRHDDQMYFGDGVKI